MIGYFIVESFTGTTDGANAHIQINASNKMDMNIKCVLFLPPYLRKTQCDISEGDTVFGIVDDVSGLGVALCGIDAADFGYFFDANVNIKKKLIVDDDTTINKALTVTNNIKSTSGDVFAGAVSLKNHTHPITVANFSGIIDPATGAASGTVTGNTDKPTVPTP